ASHAYFVFHSDVEGLSLLGAYEDSDEEDAGSRSAVNAQHSQPGDIDSTLANFMAEIVESVVALTSEEEEHQGVAASLLGPLIPSEVKEAEEKWRKRLLKGLDEPENSLDSDGEAARPAESPSIPFLDSDPDLTVQKDVSNKKVSRDQSEAEEEAEEDTMELELALERKKAELRALEEGDGSAGGSSPMSEASQEAAGSRGALLKKNRWKTVFPSVASPDSNSRGSDFLDNAETKSVVEGEGKETENSEEAGVSKLPNKEEVETPELKTRIADWREGALNGAYLRRKLLEAAEHIKYYELNATPKGWSCHWDRYALLTFHIYNLPRPPEILRCHNNPCSVPRRYFYVRDRTGASQWEFPTEEDKEEDLVDTSSTQNLSQEETKTSGSAGGATGQSVSTVS
ncbi:hypothetical protein XENOCAPTIV_007247, partial [Xenoophorus captivus]